LIVLQANVTMDDMTKPVICSRCERGKLGYIPENSEAVISRRGKPPPDKRNEGVQVKCPVCGALWTVTIE